jgi:hypothetical protein
MKRIDFSFTEFFYLLAFLLYLGGSAMAQIFNGIELSLWLMAFAMVTTFLTTVLPLFSFRWLKLETKGCRFGRGLAIAFQVISWCTFSTAMFFRLTRELSHFQTLIAITTVLWAAWLLIFIYSRHACQPRKPDDTLNTETKPVEIIEENNEDV